MKKKYEVKNNFWIGEINKEAKLNDEIGYDAETCVLTLKGQNYEVKNLKAAMNAKWIVPVDGIYPTMDRPLGETEEQFSDRKRKERFIQQSKEKNVTKLVKDDREVGKIVGCIDEDREPSKFVDALGLDLKPVQRGKYVAEVIADDTKIVEGITFDNKETEQLKKALNQNPKKEKEPSYELFTDHYDSATKNVGKYVGDNMEKTIKSWGQLHWTKKADIIKEANKDLLKELKSLESSDKIVERINKRLESL